MYKASKTGNNFYKPKKETKKFYKASKTGNNFYKPKKETKNNISGYYHG